MGLPGIALGALSLRIIFELNPIITCICLHAGAPRGVMSGARLLGSVSNYKLVVDLVRTDIKLVLW